MRTSERVNENTLAHIQDIYFDVPFLITPDIAGQIPTMIGELK